MCMGVGWVVVPEEEDGDEGLCRGGRRGRLRVLWGKALFLLGRGD